MPKKVEDIEDLGEVEDVEEVEEVEEVKSIEKVKRKQTPAQIEATRINLAKGRELRQQRCSQKKEAEAKLIAGKIEEEKKKMDKKLASKARLALLDAEYEAFIRNRIANQIDTKPKKKIIVQEEESSDEEVVVVKKKKSINIEKSNDTDPDPPPKAPPSVPPPQSFRLKRV